MAVFLFPGQGSPSSKTAILFQDACEDARGVFNQAACLLSKDEFRGIFQHSAKYFPDTRYVQPALLCTEMAIVACLHSLGVRPHLCAGYSLGEISALVASGALAFESALKLVRERARLMSLGVPEGGMMAVIGLAPEVVAEVMPETVQIGAYNGPDQVVITGDKEGLAEAAVRCNNAGARRIVSLAVSGPFHSRLMERAGRALADYLATVPLRTPAIPFLSSVSGEFEDDPDRIRSVLSEHMYQPVQWMSVMQRLAGERAVEVGSGGVLQRLAQGMPAGPNVYAADTPEWCRKLAGMLE